MFKFVDEVCPLCSEEIEDLKIYFNEDIKYLKPSRDVQEAFKTFEYILNNANYPLKNINCYDKNILGLDGISKLKKDLLIINDYLLSHFNLINFNNTCEEEIRAWYRFNNIPPITQVFHDEIEGQDEGILSDSDVVFPHSLSECKIINNDVYIHYYLIMDRMRPRNSQHRASEEFYIKDGLIKYNKIVEELKQKNEKSRLELVEKEKQKRHNKIVTFQNRYFSINRLANLLFIITSHFSGCIYEDMKQRHHQALCREQTQKIIDKIQKTFDFIIDFNDKLYKIEVV